jgi:hypothetical protein
MDKKSIPDFLTPITPMLLLFWEEIQEWISAQLYQQILGQAEKEKMVRLQGLIKFEPLEVACGGYHEQRGRGRPVKHGVKQLVRMLFLRWYGNHSLRETERQVRYHLLYRWFAGYGLWETTADHNTLHDFEKYVMAEHERLFFDTMLRQIDESLPQEREGEQIGDTFALRADAALESLVKRLRHSSQRLLTSIKKEERERYEEIMGEVDGKLLLGERKEKPECYLDKREWMERLRETVNEVRNCVRLVPKEMKKKPWVAYWVANIEKIMADELELSIDEAGQVRWVELLKGKKRGKYRICSATDPDATIRNHGEKKKDFGYNVSVATTKNFIREIQPDTGSQPDHVAIPDLLQKQQAHHGLIPEAFIYDQAAGTGKTAAAVSQVSGGKIKLIANPQPQAKKTEKLGPRDCTLAEDELSLTCPGGEVSRRKYRSGSGDGYIFRFGHIQCIGCGLLKACRGDEKIPTTHRDYFVSDYQAHYLQLVNASKTEDFKEKLKLRPQVERVIAGLVRHNGARYARFRGLEKVDFQMKMCAMAYNVKRWLKVLDNPIPATLPDEAIPRRGAGIA